VAAREEPRSPLAVALAVALVFHGAAALFGAAASRDSSGAAIRAETPHEREMLDIEVIEMAEETQRGERTHPGTERESASRLAARPGLRAARPSNVETASPTTNAAPNGDVGNEDSNYVLDPSAEGVASPTRGRSDIELGIAAGDWARWVDPAAPVDARPAEGVRPVPAPASTTGGLAEALEARDQEIGLGPAGTILSAAHDAGYSDRAPAIGTATFAITVLRSGGVEVTLTGASSQQQDWEKVGDSIAAAIRRKPPRIGPSRQGVRIGIELVAEERWPNGTTSRGEGPALSLAPGKFKTTDEGKKDLETRNPFAIPPPGSPAEQPTLKAAVEPPGLWLKGRGKVCGYAVGLTLLGPMLSGGCDPANIGAKPRRVVSTRVVNQTML